MVLPGQLGWEIRSLSGNALEYVPFPGPALSPWEGARVIAPGERVELKQTGVRDRDGIWKLAPGAYQLSVGYEVPIDFEREAGPRPGHLAGKKLWSGRLTSHSIRVEYQPDLAPGNRRLEAY